ncbi:MAG: hypothetical protein ACO208_06985, partial [Candidatus Puniceispirillaceae bacterium]
PNGDFTHQKPLLDGHLYALSYALSYAFSYDRLAWPAVSGFERRRAHLGKRCILAAGAGKIKPNWRS